MITKPDHHSHGIQNNMSQQRTCHIHDHMSLSRPHVIFTTTCHFHKRQHVSPSNNMALHDITLHYVASLGVDTQHYTSPRHTTRHYVTLRCITWRRHTTLHDPRHTTRHYVTLRCITWRRHTNIASSMLVFDCKAPLLGDHLFTQREAKAILSSSSRPTDQLAVIFSTGVPLLITFA